MADNEYVSSIVSGRLPTRVGTEVLVALPVLAIIGVLVYLTGPSPIKLGIAGLAAAWYGVRIAMIATRGRE